MTNIILLVLLIILIVPLLGMPFYLLMGRLKFFYHDILSWHKPDEIKKMTFDGCSLHSKCKYCGKDIMQDSQGNWF